MRKSARSSVAVLLYCLGVFVLFEGVSRWALSSDWFLSRAARPYDTYWRLNWIKRHRGQVEIYYRFDVYHPTRGWALKPDLRDMPAFEDKTVSSNSKGIRGRQEYAYEKAEGRRRILALGNSFTFGDEVSDTETYPYFLQQMLAESEVLNFGVHGYGNDQMLIYLREEGVKYHPDVVILGFVHADMSRNIAEFRDFAKPRFVLRENRLVLRNSPVPSPESILGMQRWRPYLLDVLGMAHERYQWRAGEKERQIEEVTAAILDEMLRTIRAAGATPVFVYLPLTGDLAASVKDRRTAEAFLLAFCDGRGVLCLSLRSAFAARISAGEDMFRWSHWSPEGHMAAAVEISKLLAERNLAGARRD